MEHGFGFRTFLFYLYQRVTPGLVLLIVGANLPAISQFVISVANINPGPEAIQTINRVGNALMAIVIVLAILIMVLGVILSILKHIGSSYNLGDYALTLKHGIIGKTEVIIPYRQIQSVDLNQSIIFRLFGLSSLIVLSAGDEDMGKKAEGDQVFNVIDSSIAEYLKEELLKRANLSR